MRIGGAPKQGDNIALLVLQSMLAFSGIRYKAVDRRDSQEATFAMQAKKHAHTHTRGSHGVCCVVFAVRFIHGPRTSSDFWFKD